MAFFRRRAQPAPLAGPAQRDGPAEDRLPLRLTWPPLALLIFGLLLTAGAVLTLIETSRDRQALRFEARVALTRAAIEQRINLHIALLQGVAGLFATGQPPDDAAFQRYVARLDVTGRYPGVQGLGFAARVPTERLTTNALRFDGGPTITVWPETTDQSERFPIVLLEPHDGRNQLALGFDMFSEPVRRQAMEQARDSGMATASGAVTLVQDLGNSPQTGFLIYVPVYEGGGIPADLAERQARLIGFAYSPFRADDLLAGVVPTDAAQEVAFSVYDGPTPTSGSLLHRSPELGGARYRPTFEASEVLTIAGRPWTIVYRSQPAFDTPAERFLPPLAGLIGVALSLLAFAVAWSQSRARHQAELAVRARETFLSIASHELKTPLTSLYGNAQLLQRRASRATGLGERERSSINVIVDQARRLTVLIDGLLDHSRLQQGRIELQRELIDLRDLARRAADDLRPTLSTHTLNLKLPDEPLPVHGDVTRLEQVLTNLLSNAVKYSPGGGPIDLIAARSDGYATVTVADRGLGIPAATQAQLFSPFFRGSNAVHHQIGGLGIGLYVVKELVTRHNGAVAVNSKEGEGSSFTVSLPLAGGEHDPDAG